MAGPKTTVKSKSESKKRYFLCCFGNSRKSSKPKQFQDEANRKRKDQLFFWKRFGVKKAEIQTVPVDTTAPRNLNPVSEIEEVPSSPDQTVNPKPLIKNSISETRQSSESNSCQDSGKKRNCISEQASPREKFSSLTKALSHSVSFPAIQATGMARKGLGIRKVSRKFDTVIGMSIIMVTLVIMVIWGFRNGETMVETPMSIKEYKKNVVLEGLLPRSRRKYVGL